MSNVANRIGHHGIATRGEAVLMATEGTQRQIAPTRTVNTDNGAVVAGAEDIPVASPTKVFHLTWIYLQELLLSSPFY